MKKWIVRVIISIIVLITLFYYSPFYGLIPRYDGRFKYVERLYNKGELIGLSIDECREKLGDEYILIYREDYIVYNAGYRYYPFKDPSYWSCRIIVYFDEKGIVVDNEFSEIP